LGIAPPNQPSPERAKHEPTPHITPRWGGVAAPFVGVLARAITGRPVGARGAGRGWGAFAWGCCAGLVCVSPFQGWVGWEALFPGRCPGLSPLAALRPKPTPLATPPSCRVVANADPIGALRRLAALRPTPIPLAHPLHLAVLWPTPGPLMHLFRFAAFEHVSPHQRPHNDCPYPRAPTGRHAIAQATPREHPHRPNGALCDSPGQRPGERPHNIFKP